MFDNLSTNDPLEDQYDVKYVDDKGKYTSAYTAYGLQCIAKESKLTADALLKKSDSVDNWFNTFTKNTRDELELTKKKALINTTEESFCREYECKSASVKDTKSCKAGGPLSYQDLSDKYKCGNPDDKDSLFPSNPRAQFCNEEVLKKISYMKDLKAIQTIANGDGDQTNDSSSNSSNKRKKLPDFAENYLGVEKTLQILGIPVTPANIADRAEDFKQRNIDPTVEPYSPNEQRVAKASTSQNSNQKVNQETASSSSISPAYNPTRSISSPSTASASSKKAIADSSTIKNNDKKLSKEDLDNNKEIRDLIEQLKSDKEVVKNDINKNEEKISKAIASNSKPSPADIAERERLRRIERDLNSREDSLNRRQRELDEKYAAQSEQLAPKGAGPVPVAASANPDSSNAVGQNKQAQLSATKTEQKPNTAALIQSDKESKAISTDELSSLSPDKLNELGINTKLPFILRVNFENKIHQVTVNSIPNNGKIILAPVLDPKEKKLKDFLLGTALFKPYVEYRQKNGNFADTFKNITNKK